MFCNFINKHFVRMHHNITSAIGSIKKKYWGLGSVKDKIKQFYLCQFALFSKIST